ncbi:MAG: DUF721 domain-containing protein [Bacteroidales bacterium]|nr:DUF721 domain-containing protein [Bacteroidales bacterium]
MSKIKKEKSIMIREIDTSKKISEVLLDIFNENNLGAKMLENRAVSLWHAVVGPTVSKYTKNVYMNNGVLHVEMSSSVVRQEMIMLKKKVIENINKAVGDDVVEDVVFR